MPVSEVRRSRLVFDVLLVVVSVLLGMALGDWRDSRERAALQAKVLVALGEELAANRKAIDEAIPRQQRLSDAFQQALVRYTDKREFVFPEEAREQRAGLRFSRAAYDSAAIAQVLPRLQVSTLLALSGFYAEIDFYNDLLRTYASATAQTDFNDGARYLRLLSNEYAQLAEAEARMRTLLDAASAAVAAERAER